LASIGKVIAASAATVAVTFFAMIFTRLPVFFHGRPGVGNRDLCGVRGSGHHPAGNPGAHRATRLIKPRRELTTRFWRRSGIRIVRRPKVHLVASLVVLAILASCAGFAHYNYDDRKTLPDSSRAPPGTTP